MVVFSKEEGAGAFSVCFSVRVVCHWSNGFLNLILTK